MINTPSVLILISGVDLARDLGLMQPLDADESESLLSLGPTEYLLDVLERLESCD